MEINTYSTATVNAYSGYRANERPISFSFGDNAIRVIKIIDHRIDPERDYFSVQGDDGRFYTLEWFREKDIWHVKEKMA